MILIEYVALLNRKQDLLDKIIGNTESQIRFIRKQKMVGLTRLLRTRGQLLETLAILIEQEKEGRQWNDQLEVQKLRQHIQKAQQIILAASAVAIQTALDEKKRIAEQMVGNAKTRELRQTYIGRWYQGVSRGFSRKV